MAPWLLVNGVIIAILSVIFVVVSGAWLFFLANFVYGFFVDNGNCYLFFDLTFVMGLYAIVLMVILGIIQYPYRRGMDLYSEYKRESDYLQVANVHGNY